MTEVFISYASEDRDRARAVANALETLGWSVWWDRDILAGESFDQVIERHLDVARCVVVLWSKHSIGSEWVKNEAAFAAERGVLVPALIDDVRPPLEFRRRQAADLVRWEAKPSHEGFVSLCDGIRRNLDTAGSVRRPDAAMAAKRPPRFRRWVIGVTASIVIAGFAAALFQTHLSDLFTGKRHAIDEALTSSASPLGVLELEPMLKLANIELSTGSKDDVARVRGYFTGADSPYHLLAVHTLQVVGTRRMIKTAYLDMIDKWYTLLVGSQNYVTDDGGLDHEKLKIAITKANNDYYGDNASSFEEIVRPRS